jgi:hypothetical protein
LLEEHERGEEQELAFGRFEADLGEVSAAAAVHDLAFDEEPGALHGFEEFYVEVQGEEPAVGFAAAAGADGSKGDEIDVRRGETAEEVAPEVLHAIHERNVDDEAARSLLDE